MPHDAACVWARISRMQVETWKMINKTKRTWMYHFSEGLENAHWLQHIEKKACPIISNSMHLICFQKNTHSNCFSRKQWQQKDPPPFHLLLSCLLCHRKRPTYSIVDWWRLWLPEAMAPASHWVTDGDSCLHQPPTAAFALLPSNHHTGWRECWVA